MQYLRSWRDDSSLSLQLRFYIGFLNIWFVLFFLLKNEKHKYSPSCSFICMTEDKISMHLVAKKCVAIKYKSGASELFQVLLIVFAVINLFILGDFHLFIC